MKRFALLAVALFALAACDDKKTDTKPEDPTAKNATSATATGAETAKPPTPQAVSINDSDISTPADFEEAAEKSIDKKNYKTELTTLETDIAKD
jgi:hypothetical protein